MSWERFAFHVPHSAFIKSQYQANMHSQPATIPWGYGAMASRKAFSTRACPGGIADVEEECSGV